MSPQPIHLKPYRWPGRLARNWGVGHERTSPQHLFLLTMGLALGITVLGNPPAGLAEEIDPHPITFTIVNGGGDPAIPDVIDSTDNSLHLDVATIVGLAGSEDTVTVAIDAATTWNLTAPNAGTVAIEGYSGVVFSGIDNLVGGAGEDAFVLSPDAGLGRTIDGGPGANTLDYSAFATGVTVNLGTHTATRTNGVSNIQDVIGGAGADTLTGDSQDNVFIGGTGKDTITGDDGLDTLVETRDAAFALTDTSLIIGLEGKDTLSDIEAARLTGGPASNLLNATNFSGSAVLDGAEGNDTLRGGSGDDVLIGGPGNDGMTGGAGDDEYTGGPGLNTLTEVTTGGVDTVIETCDASFVLTGTSLVWGEGTDQPLGNIEDVHLIGGPGDNRFDISALVGGSVSVDGGEGYDT